MTEKNSNGLGLFLLGSLSGILISAIVRASSKTEAAKKLTAKLKESVKRNRTDDTSVDYVDDFDFNKYSMAINPVKFYSRNDAVDAAARACYLIEENGFCSYKNLIEIKRDIDGLDTASFSEYEDVYKDSWNRYGWRGIDDILPHTIDDKQSIWIISDIEPYKL